MSGQVTNEFKGCVKKWVTIDSKLSKLRKLSSELRKEKEKYQDYILDYMSSNNEERNILIRK